MMDHNINAAAVTAAAHGQWREILTANGINLPDPKRRSGCPVCGGKDRFRFDDQEGRGTWQQATGQSMSEAIRSLASYFGLSGQMTTADHARIEQRRQKAAKAAEQQRVKEARQRDAAAALAQQMELEAAGCMAEQVPYLARKGLSGFGVEVLARTYHHEDDGKQYSYKAGSLLVVLFNIDGVTTSAEIIDSEGRKMALAGGQKTEWSRGTPPACPSALFLGAHGLCSVECPRLVWPMRPELPATTVQRPRL